MYFKARFRDILIWTSFVSSLLAAPHNPRAIAQTTTRSPDYNIETMHEFPNPTWLENIAVRSNGQILVTQLASTPTTPFVWLVDPTKSWDPILVADIPDAAGVLGIAELEDDVFYVVAGRGTLVEIVPGSNAIWRVDLRTLLISSNGTVTQPAEITRVAVFPESVLFNGLCRLSKDDKSTLLIADSIAGSVIRVDVRDGSNETVIKDASMTTPTGRTGINGIHTFGTYLYFTNTGLSTFSRVPISLSTGKATGDITTIVNNTLGDDFIISRDGSRAWIAQSVANTVTEVDIHGRAGKVIAGSLGDVEFATATAVAFGRGESDKNSLYVTTAGGLGSPVNGSIVTGGRIVKIDLLR
ncbi:hypothetical protein PVAG01_05933 [Phlyctema vagabunda]|uniref:Uncharacterized protein n=1 Tax=Phlyctema vagabunda TaxID=108571 RepID=A0ABR4PF96_9HELO